MLRLRASDRRASPARASSARALACLALCALLAGCSGGGADGREEGGTLPGSTETQIVEGDPGSAAGLGRIAGRVLDDTGIAVAGAGVALLGTELSASSAKDGTFAFANVTPGDFVLRVVSSIYRAHEGAVTVQADRLTEVTVTLVPQDDRGPGYRPHLHDYWGSEQELQLLDVSLDWAGEPSCTGSGNTHPLYAGLYQPTNGNWWVCLGIPERGDGRPPIVLPGTASLRIRLDWDPADVTAREFKLGYHSAGMGAGTFVDMPAFARGQERTLELQPIDADNGHQSFSVWRFRLQPVAQSPPAQVMGPIQVTATMVKGAVPAEPAHEDFWNGSSEYAVRNHTTERNVDTLCCTDNYVFLAPDGKRLVPPGTKELRLTLSWRSSYAPGTAHDLDWSLAYRPANLPPDTPAQEYTKLTPATTITTGLKTKTYVLPVSPAQTDAFYQKQSNWEFLAILPQEQHTQFGTLEAGHKIQLGVTADKDPGFV